MSDQLARDVAEIVMGWEMTSVSGHLQGGAEGL